jgi:hypothetical protein
METCDEQGFRADAPSTGATTTSRAAASYAKTPADPWLRTSPKGWH